MRISRAALSRSITRARVHDEITVITLPAIQTRDAYHDRIARSKKTLLNADIIPPNIFNCNYHKDIKIVLNTLRNNLQSISASSLDIEND